MWGRKYWVLKWIDDVLTVSEVFPKSIGLMRGSEIVYRANMIRKMDLKGFERIWD